jgi:hypothetical protein
MRVKFRIAIHKEGKKLSKEGLLGKRDPFWVGVRYITEFRYLEATKWLMLARDCYEKYLLLALTNLALGQESQAREFDQEALNHKPCHALEIFLEMPEKGKRIQVKEGCNLGELIYTYLHEERQG